MFDEDKEKPAMAEATTHITHELVEKYTLRNLETEKPQKSKNWTTN